MMLCVLASLVKEDGKEAIGWILNEGLFLEV